MSETEHVGFGIRSEIVYVDGEPVYQYSQDWTGWSDEEKSAYTYHMVAFQLQLNSQDPSTFDWPPFDLTAYRARRAQNQTDAQ